MQPRNDDALALPKGSLILVTGASGFIGAHIVNEALKAGYRVRGTSRSQERADYTNKVFDNPDYTTTVVADVQKAGIWDTAVEGVDAVIHVATDVSFNPDPNIVVKPTEEGVKNILRSAKRSSTVKRFVLTSSAAAAVLPGAGRAITVGVDDWCEEAVEEAWKPPPYLPERAFYTYAASKVAGEKALWKFMEAEQPSFVANAVLPFFNLGTILTSGGPTGSIVPTLLRGEVPDVPPREPSLQPYRHG